MTKGSALPSITHQGTGPVEVEVLDSETGAKISSFELESRELAERYCRSQVRLHEQLLANLPVNMRYTFHAPEFLIDGDQFDGEATA